MVADINAIRLYVGIPCSNRGQYSPLSRPLHTPTSLPARCTHFAYGNNACSFTSYRCHRLNPARNTTFFFHHGQLNSGFASSSWGVFLHRLSPTAWEASATCQAFGQPVCFCGCIGGFIDLVILPSLHLACLSAFDSADRGG